MARIKSQAPVVCDQNGAKEALRRIAELERGIAAVDADMNENIDTIKRNAHAEAAPLVEERKALVAALNAYAELHRGKLFAKRKSLDLGFGVIGFRLSTKIATATKVTLAQVLERLKDLGFKDAVRVKEQVDREAMRGWPDERLASVGMRRVETDEFYIEINEEAVEDAA